MFAKWAFVLSPLLLKKLLWSWYNIIIFNLLMSTEAQRGIMDKITQLLTQLLKIYPDTKPFLKCFSMYKIDNLG